MTTVDIAAAIPSSERHEIDTCSYSGDNNSKNKV